MKRSRKIRGNCAALSASRPKARANPATHTNTSPSAQADGDGGVVRELQMTNVAPSIERIAQTVTSEDKRPKMRFLSRNSSHAEINGIRTMCDASSFPRE